jgi:hypothetical protein
MIVWDGAEIFKEWIEPSSPCFHHEFVDVVPPSTKVTDDFVLVVQEKVAALPISNEPLYWLGQVGTSGEIKDRLVKVYTGLACPEKIPLFLDAFRTSQPLLGTFDFAKHSRLCQGYGGQARVKSIACLP